jgi:type I restriction enzyme S subunit
MEVRKGYKQTEVGIIPNEWEVKTFGDLFYISGGLSASRDQLSADGYCYLHYGDIHLSYKTFIDVQSEFQDIPKLNVPLNKVSSASLLKDGDIVFVDASEDDEGASKHVVIINPEGIPFISGLHTIVVKGKTNELGHQYRRFCFQTRAVKKQFRFYSVGTKVTGISKTNIAKITLPIPALLEQEAIAEALSDADALIEAIEQLLAKKRQVKQGAMSELLTGKRRLSGFSGEWEEKSLLELAEGKKELFDDGDWIEAEHITDDGVRLVQTGNIGIGRFVEKEDKKYIYPSSFVSLHCKELRQGDLLICRLAEPAGRACVFPDIGDARVITSVDVTIFRPPASIANRVFLTNIFSTNQWFREVNDKSGGTTHKRISRGSLGRIKIKLPHIDEQTAIAEILSDMDAEISALEEKLVKARQVKAGMMSVLLTGKIRLV